MAPTFNPPPYADLLIDEDDLTCCCVSNMGFDFGTNLVRDIEVRGSVGQYRSARKIEKLRLLFLVPLASITNSRDQKEEHNSLTKPAWKPRAILMYNNRVSRTADERCIRIGSNANTERVKPGLSKVKIECCLHPIFGQKPKTHYWPKFLVGHVEK